ncbi:MAG: class I SAM-dependent methyltransferase [Proteobacteria bacterium]|nr:MAG: class I SAM-dependent methyltransferase [Pseudomonadota bacterium]
MSLELISHCGLDRRDLVIDVGGGASMLVDRLLGLGFSRICVLDISSAALAVSRRRLGVDAKRVRWIESDVRRYESGIRVALWHDRAVFHFLTAVDDRRRYRDALARSLLPGGHVIVAAFAIGGPRECSGLPVVQYDARKLSAELGPAFRLIEERTEAHVTPSGRVQEFAWFRLVRVGE